MNWQSCTLRPVCSLAIIFCMILIHILVVCFRLKDRILVFTEHCLYWLALLVERCSPLNFEMTIGPSKFWFSAEIPHFPSAIGIHWEFLFSLCCSGSFRCKQLRPIFVEKNTSVTSIYCSWWTLSIVWVNHFFSDVWFWDKRLFHLLIKNVFQVICVLLNSHL